MPTFVIQEHNASHLHWDFRLELSGVLKSWAIPKTPPFKKGIKRLAIQVDDHPKSYADFEGEIKEGYGKGSVRIWDKGNFSLKERTPKKIVFILQGKVMKGEYALIKTDYGDKKNSWLLMKID
ncbi:MAG: DNA polymerase ligase N-terminal domain-containing protein [Nanoarchaeota archaeon]